MTNTNKTIQRLAINIKSILKQNNMEYSQAFIDVNRIIILAGENTKPIRQLGIGIRSNEHPADRIRDIISKLTTQDLEYLYHVKTGRSGI